MSDLVGNQDHCFSHAMVQIEVQLNRMGFSDFLVSLRCVSVTVSINPSLTNGFHYHLDESSVIFRGFMCDFKIVSHFSVKFL